MGLVLESGLMELAYVAVFAFWLLFTYFVRDYDYWTKRGVPQVTPVFPLGSLPGWVWRRVHFTFPLHQVYQRFSHHRFFGLVDVRTPSLVINDTAIIRDILTKNFNHFTDRNCGEMNCDSNEYLNKNLMSMRGNEWKLMRIKLSPAYTTCKMKIMFFLVKGCCDYLRQAIQQKIKVSDDVDVKDLVKRFTIDVIGNCAFGLNVNTLNDDDSQFLKITKSIFHYDFVVLLKVFLLSAFPVLYNFSTFNTVKPEVTDYITNLIRETVAYREKNNVNRFDFLDLLIKIKQNESILDESENNETINGGAPDVKNMKNEGITIEEIAAETYVFFAAGYETSSSVIAWCLYELACNQTIQDKVYREIEDVLNRCEGDISFQTLQKITYLDNVINETMRLHPPISVLNRVCTQRYQIPNSDVELEEGITVIIPVYSLHHDARYFPQPEIFDPERFSEENCHNRSSYAFLPFGEGPRMCIGLRFGLMLVKAAVATLVNDYAFSLHPDTPFPLQVDSKSCTVQPSHPLRLVLSRRARGPS